MNWLIGICAVICGWIVYCSRKGTVNNGAQHVVTVGMLFTFLGISFGLYSFDTDAAKMIDSINEFLDSMKLAFVTSIIGMVAGLWIKFLQRNVKPTEDVTNETLRDILAAIRQSNNDEFNRTLRDFADAMGKLAPDLRNLSASMHEQSEKLERLGTTLKQSIDALSAKQVERLDVMNFSIDKMRRSTAQAEQNSAALLEATKAYQQQALANDDTQLKILSDNTAQIVAMKNAFDQFLQDMAKSFGDNFIAALTLAIKDLNNNLQEQFGDNFKELNAAVREVAAWQREYKDIVTATTTELKVINETFSREVMGELKASLKTFADTSAQNVSVQANLSNATAQLSAIITQTEESLNHMKTVTATFGKFSEEVLDKNAALLQNHLNNLRRLEENFSAEVKTINNVAHGVALDTTQYLKDFNTASAESMRVIRDTIARYKADLNKETEASLSKLHQLFETLANNTDAQSDKAIKNLAGALAKVSGRMIDNYQVLVAKIAEVDALLNERRRLR